MKKLLYFALMALLAMPIMFSCKEKNNPNEPTKEENPWTDEEPGTEDWLEDLITGEEEDEIMTYSEEDLQGTWRFGATAITDKKGNILSWGDNYQVGGDIDRGGSVGYMQLFVSEHKSTYSSYRKENGVPIIRTTEGTWELNKHKITFVNKSMSGNPYVDETNMTIELLEKERLVLKTEYFNTYENKSGVYYEIYERVPGLPDISNVKMPQEIFVSSTWKVTSDTTCINAWSDNPDGTFKKNDCLDKKLGTFKDCTFKFNSDSTLTLTDAAGKVSTYKWTWMETSITDPLIISFVVSEINDKWPAPNMTEFNSYYELAGYGYEKTLLRLFAWTREGVEVPAGYEHATRNLEINLEPK